MGGLACKGTYVNEWVTGDGYSCCGTQSSCGGIATRSNEVCNYSAKIYGCSGACGIEGGNLVVSEQQPDQEPVYCDEALVGCYGMDPQQANNPAATCAGDVCAASDQDTCCVDICDKPAGFCDCANCQY